MQHFFVLPEEIQGDRVHFSMTTSWQIARVLRLKAGEKVLVLDNSGFELHTELLVVHESESVGRITQRLICESEPKTRLLMILSLSQREKFEWMLQKCTEVGAAAFLPIITSRSLIQKTSDAEAKYPRWKMILKEAAEQSERGKLPELLAPTLFEECIQKIPQEYSLCLIPWEEERDRSLKMVLGEKTGEKIAVMIGPEGGFSQFEVELAVRAGFEAVTLGKRILRMETAAVVAAALVLNEVEGG